tara:strand:- start:1332 stop:2162 length:831 start_codon:yes stop_codon:yes gene_type:complete
MKTLLILLFPLISFTQILVKNELYEVVYSEFYQQPISLNYKYPNPFEYKSLRIDTVSFKPMLVKRVLKFDSLNYAVANSVEGKIMLNAGYYVDKNGKVTNRMIYNDEEKDINIEYPKANEIKIDTIINKVELKSFKVPFGINTSDNEDYNKPYDKGHLVPKTSFTETKYEDFMYSFLNCALMHRTLNRGLWLSLEKREREISKSAVLKVKILLSFGKNNVVDGGASIPDFFTKILEYRKFDKNDEEIYVREVYTFPNDESVRGLSIDNYKVKSLSI